jgi:hypothetical protein
VDVIVVIPVPEIEEATPSFPCPLELVAEPPPPTVIVYCSPGVNCKAVSAEPPPPDASELKEFLYPPAPPPPAFARPPDPPPAITKKCAVTLGVVFISTSSSEVGIQPFVVPE